MDQAKPKNQSFLRNTGNAVITQVFVALCIYLILVHLKFQAKTIQSLQQMSRFDSSEPICKTGVDSAI